MYGQCMECLDQKRWDQGSNFHQDMNDCSNHLDSHRDMSSSSNHSGFHHLYPIHTISLDSRGALQGLCLEKRCRHYQHQQGIHKLQQLH